MALIKHFKNQLERQPVFGIFSKTIDSSFVEVAGLSGLDFIILDMEHGSATLETIHHHVRAALIGNTVPIVRVKSVDSYAIGSALDSGALGVQVPNISTAEQAKEAIFAARFYPQGMRGVCRFVRAAEFGNMAKQTYFDKANQALLVLQVEGMEGIANLDSILELDGFDVLFVGPYDLSQSIGRPGEVDHPEVLQLISEIADKAKKKGKVLGAFSDLKERNSALVDEGFHYIAYSVDVNIFSQAITQFIREARGA